MHNAPLPPPCPHCGFLESKAIGKHYEYPMGGGPWNSQPEAIRYTYQCRCGMAYTHCVREVSRQDSNGNREQASHLAAS